MPVELPKLSAFTKILAEPEVSFENLVRESFKFEIPPGPQSVLLNIQTLIESGTFPTPETVLPKAPKFSEILAKLPSVPPIAKEEIAKFEQSTAKEEVKEVKEEVNEEVRIF